MWNKLAQAMLIVLLGSSLLYAGSRWNDNNTEPQFNPTAQVTKTASYTATLSDSYIKVTTSTADLTVTLPAISTLSTNGLGSKSYKIEKTDAVRYDVLIAPASGNTIDGTTGYAITYDDDFVVLSATAGSTDWQINYSDEVVNTAVATGFVTIGGDTTINSYATESTAATDTLTGSQCGTTIFLNVAGGFTTTLPVPTAGCSFRFIVKVAPTTAYIIATNAGADIMIGGINELEVDTADDGPYDNNADTFNFVASVAAVGDFVYMISDGTSWYYSGQTNLDGGVTTSTT